MACSIVLIVVGTNLVLGALFFFVSGHMARLTRKMLEANQELMRNVWALAAARDPSAPLAGHLASAAQTHRPPPDPFVQRVEPDEALLYQE